MIYEFRTYTLTTGAMPKVLEMFGEAYEHRKKYSELAAFWRTEFGPLNRIIHVWPYENMNHRDEVRAATVKDPNWPPGFAQLGLVVDQRSDVFQVAPNSDFAAPGQYGPVYELRDYTMKIGMMPKFLEIWESAIGARKEFSPLTTALYTELGGLNRFIHIWPYEGLEHRAEVRRNALESGKWPPKGGAECVDRQENMILTPAPFSPLQ
ncbi:MAG: hypothetical protein CL569_13350 [Alphaproteobacteria bacterium]|nr:hypothetical protein [Alphaproteobacteria bacterium]|tara:strand:+ start:13857 stop:14480 length:624 start_codon:yes stop_codon:yes gene_type:complete